MVSDAPAARKPRTATPAGRRGAALPVLVCLTAALAAGCTDAGAAARSGHASPRKAAGASVPAAPACRRPAPAALPNAAGSVTEKDSGAVCLPRGKQLDVFLTAPGKPGTQRIRWDPITTSDPGVAAPRNNGILTPPVGVRPGIFEGVRPGTAVLSSHLPGGGDWRLTVVVR